MGSHPVIVPGRVFKDTVIQKDKFSDRTKLIVLGLTIVIACLCAWAIQPPKHQTTAIEPAYDAPNEPGNRPAAP